MRFGHRFESRYYQKSTLSEDLIVAWPLDEASGTRYPDYGGTEFNLTDVDTVGTADAPAGIGGLCANFNGTSEYLYCADPFAPPAALSVAAWIRPATVAAGTRMVISHGRAGVDADLSWQIYVANATPTAVLSANGSTALASATASNLSANTEYHLCLVWDGSTLRLYRNASSGAPAAATGSLFNSPANLTIGANGSTPTNFFNGRVAQPLVWSRAITSAEITYLYSSGNGRPLSDWL